MTDKLGLGTRNGNEHILRISEGGAPGPGQMWRGLSPFLELITLDCHTRALRLDQVCYVTVRSDPFVNCRTIFRGHGVTPRCYNFGGYSTF